MISPLIVGKGRAGGAIAKSLMSLAVTEPELRIADPVWVPRNASLNSLFLKHEDPILIVANPPGLHAKTILAADQAGFKAILCEKPSCVSLAEIDALEEIKANVGVFHVYRQMWGPQTLKAMLDQGEMGDLICIEGRYWQASTAERALSSEHQSLSSWKNNPDLAGPSDTLLDVGSQWADAVCFLYGDTPLQTNIWKSYKNAERPHRDSHIQLVMDFPGGGRAFGSISKTMHGATNHFEINLIGTKKSATWNFLNPDEILVGEGRDRRVITRKVSSIGSFHPAFHGLGWLEGYIEICRQFILEVRGVGKGNYPRLSENLSMIRILVP